jgi:hypothetical protein
MKWNFQHKYYSSLFVALFLLVCELAIAQARSRDLKDVMQDWRKIPEEKHASQLMAGKTYYSLLPFVGYGPANGYVLGAAVSFSRLLGDPPTNLSSAMLNCQITTQKQFIANLRSKVYLAGNKRFLEGDWRLLIFTQPTYGLGINSAETKTIQLHINNLSENTETVGEPMQYNQIRFHEEITAKLGDTPFFAGVGISVDQHFNIVDERLDTITQSPGFFITSHYKYSVANNFNPLKYGTNGIKLMLLTDTRDNHINTYSGYFVSLSILYNVKIGNNSQQSTQMLYDARYFLGLSEQNPRHLLAFWSLGTFLMNGKVPYLALPAIGWDTYNRSGRGFIQGRFRGLNMMYNEVEYRFPVTRNGLLGGTVFLNATNANNYQQNLFNKTAFGFGGGLRLQMDKLSRTNLGIDFGIGSDHSGGVYFNLQETF